MRGIGWLGSLIALAHVGVVCNLKQMRLLAVGLAASIPILGALSGTLVPTTYPVAIGASLAFGLAAAFTGQFAQAIFEGRWAVQAQQAELQARVGSLAGILSRAAAGDLSDGLGSELDEVATASHAEQDVIGELTSAFKDTLFALRDLVQQIGKGGQQLSAGATQLLATAQTEATNSSEQSVAVASASAAIEELAATAAHIAAKAKAVALCSAETAKSAQDGRDAVAASVLAIQGIGEHVQAIATQAANLGERTADVGRILSVIDELADQTNLLALNAAIEAARAGEHGRGFAVVAAEVRSLAERAQESTGQIQAIITQIQAGTAATIQAADRGISQARSGAEIAQNASVALDQITDLVDQTTGAAQEISTATTQQRTASDQVVEDITGIAQLARQSAAASTESAQAAADLNSLADDLTNTIARFKLSG